eukprot:4864044-Amphidinium_carterae.1
MSSNWQHFSTAAVVGAAAGVAGVATWTLLQRSSDDTAGESLATKGNRSKNIGYGARWTKPVVIAGTSGLEELGSALSSALGCEKYNDAEGQTVSMEKFKSGDPNLRFNWERLVGRKIIFLFDT